MKQFLIEFEHDSKRLGMMKKGWLLISADTFPEACEKIKSFGTAMTNQSNGYRWIERFENPRNFINLTIS